MRVVLPFGVKTIIIAQGRGDRTKCPSGVQRRSLGRESGALCSPEAEAVRRHCLQILTAEKIKFENFTQFTS